MDSSRPRWPAAPAHFAVPIGATALLCLGAMASALHGGLSGLAVAVLCGLVVTVTAAVTDPKAAGPLAIIAWMTASSFARAPFGALHPTARQATYAAACAAGGALLGAATGIIGRFATTPARERTLEGVGLPPFASAVDKRRQAYGWALAVVLLPGLTVIVTGLRAQLSLTDNLLIYLLGVVAVAVVGGFWPAIFAAIGASLLINWYFTPPYHTLTIAEPDNLLSLLLFIVVAIAVSSVVHLAARRLILARRARAESEALARLARSVLGGEDAPSVVLRHLHTTLVVGAELLERVGSRWVRVAYSGDLTGESHRLLARDDVALVVYGDIPEGSDRVLEAAASQAAAALDRDRLRTQAAQAEALAAGNRMRTALLAAVSHDLRTPLASIKASITSLRQSDVHWSPQDEAVLLETIEQSSDRLDNLIANLLDMSRVQTGALQPYLRAAAVDEIAPLALRGIDGGDSVRLEVPEDLPLVLTDAGLLERALANLLANAVRFSPPDQPAELTASARDGVVDINVIDHGPGVPPADRDRMFEPFQRLGDQDATTGIGLGLAVARGFIDAVGGELRPGDTPGGGLTMTASLPLAAAAERRQRPQVES